ncbi:MAG: 5-deoxy-glucuronate isomerase [Chloroflexota bacterium]|nr:5-deoxy-glucuronate isomerase [Chloroflexota bacterium]
MTDVAAEIPATAPPNDLTPDQLRVKPDADGVSVRVGPQRAGWRYLSFQVRALAEGEGVPIASHGREAAVVVLAGRGVQIDLPASGRLQLDGRASVFDDLPAAAYLPAGSAATIVGQPGQAHGRTVVAIAEAPASGRPGASEQPVLIGPDDIEVEIRGAGNATRQVNHIIRPEFPADRLLLVEVYTPAGNWSSWPPHKHDVDAMPGEAVLEEIYYYQLRRPEGWALQRLYRRDGSRDALWAVRQGELVLVTDGYHPFVAAHGYDAYYLNALAGDRRTMAFSDDPDLAWTRQAWEMLPPDPRVPLVRRGG